MPFPADECPGEHPDCTCGWTAVGATDIDPPEPKLNRDCPVHGIDPDEAYERWRDERDAEEKEGYDDSKDFD
jgi:hypothetical protein